MNGKTLLVVLLCLLMVVSTYGRALLNYSTAVEKCKKRNGLASYKHFVNPERRIEYTGKVLGHGESLWISGNISFSDMFVRKYGCSKPPNKGLQKYNISRNNIYECLKKCSRAGLQTKYKYKYIGIGSECYCMSHGDLIHSSDCNQQFPMINYVSGDVFSTEYAKTKTSIDVYLVIDKQILITKKKNLGQCVYYEKNGTERSYVSGSCYTKEIGFICTNRDYFVTPVNCSNDKYLSSGSRKYCYYSEQSTWISSFKNCKQNSLNLIGTLDKYITKEIDKSKISASFWTGLFRTFNLSEFQNKEFAEESNICLSVMNMNNTLVFDPVDCSLEKGYICEDDISNIEEQTTEPSDESNSLSPTTVEVVHGTSVQNLALVIALTILVPLLILVCIIAGKKIKNITSARQNITRSDDIQDNNPTNIYINLGPENMLSSPRSQEAGHQFGNPEVDYEILNRSEAFTSEYDILNTD